MRFRTCTIICAAIAALGPAAAETRFYQSPDDRGVAMERIVDAMSARHIQFSVRSVFNEKRDGKVGFVFLLRPSRRYCEIAFYPGRDGSLVRVLTQTTADAGLFHNLLVGTLKLRAIGEDPAKFGDVRGFSPRRQH